MELPRENHRRPALTTLKCAPVLAHERRTGLRSPELMARPSASTENAEAHPLARGAPAVDSRWTHESEGINDG